MSDEQLPKLTLAMREVERLTRENDELHAELRRVVDYAIDVVGMPVSTMLGPDAPSRTMRKLHADLQHAVSENFAFNIKAASEINEARSQRDKLRALCREACEIGLSVVADTQVLPSTDSERLAAIRDAVEQGGEL